MRAPRWATHSNTTLSGNTRRFMFHGSWDEGSCCRSMWSGRRTRSGEILRRNHESASGRRESQTGGQIPEASVPKVVGWVERSEPHHKESGNDFDCARSAPHLITPARKIRAGITGPAERRNRSGRRPWSIGRSFPPAGTSHRARHFFGRTL